MSPEPEYDVAWNGCRSEAGQEDTDLLLVAGNPVKNPGRPSIVEGQFAALNRPPRRPIDVAHTAVWRYLRGRTGTVWEIGRALVMGQQEVETVLHYLVRHRRVVSEPIPLSERKFAERKRYRLAPLTRLDT